jgi:tetratricopeptide (TPR) repeat protein
VGRRLALLAAAVALVGSTAPVLRGADDVDWRGRALALNDITGEDPIDGEIKILLDDPAGTKKLLAAAAPLAREKNQPFNYNAAYILAQAAQRLKDYQAGEVFYQICTRQAIQMGSVRKLFRAYTGLLGIIDLLYLDKKYDRSAALCQEFLETLERERVGEGAKEEILRRMVRALTKQDKLTDATKMLDTLLKARGNDWRNVELKGWFERETGHFGKSAKTYEGLLEIIANDKSLEKDEKTELQTDVHYVLSGVYVDLNRIDKAGEHLQTLLKEHPNDPAYNNDLGYIWADHDMNLDEAERMIRKALQEDRKQRRKADPEQQAEESRDNAAYLDSLGWVLFKKKKYEEAKPVLLQAVKDKDGQHVEIFDHLGEVYMALGDQREAVGAWKKGIAVAGPSKKEQEKKAELEKKVRQHQ